MLRCSSGVLLPLDERVIAVKQVLLCMEFFHHVLDCYRSQWQAMRYSVQQMVRELVDYAAEVEWNDVGLGARLEEVSCDEPSGEIVRS